MFSTFRGWTYSLVLTLWSYSNVDARRVWLQQPVNSELSSVRLGDGCRHVFLDVGANRGLHVRYLMEGRDVFPQAWYIDWYFDQTFGPQFVNDTTVCAFAFEPNPLHDQRLRQLSMRLRAKGRRVEIISAAAYNQTGTLTFQRSGNEAENQGWGFAAQTKDNRQAGGLLVPTIDLADFVRREIIGRRIPPPPAIVHAANVRPPSIAMKMDIEGGELVVLERMRALDVLCQLSVISLEYHPSKLYADGTNDPNTYAAHSEIFDAIHDGVRIPHTDLGAKAGQRWGRLTKIMEERQASVARRRGSKKAFCPNTRFINNDYEGYPQARDVVGPTLPG